MAHKFISFLLLFSLSFVNSLIGHEQGVKEKSNYPVEQLTVHLSQKSVFSGEAIWFKIYCTSSLYPKTELSKMAFIELVSEENAVLLRKKILLKQGAGKGEFMLPENIQTGIYHILAYTNWLKNFGEKVFFKTKIIIINPEEEFTFEVAEGQQNKLSISGKSVEFNRPGGILITTDKQKYITREKVEVKFEITEKVSGGNFSIAVYHKEPLKQLDNKLIDLRAMAEQPESITYLPDYKGVRLTGNITDDSGKPVTGERVILSTPGPGTNLNDARTSANGNFHFLLEPGFGDKDVVFTLPYPNLKLRLEESFWNGFKNQPDKSEPQLDKEAVSYLKERYANFQLMKKFKQQNFKKATFPDTIKNKDWRFYSDPHQVINLSDYITLDSLTEYFWELSASVKFKPRKGMYNIEVIDPLTHFPFEDKPGVFVDGVLYSDYNEIAAIPVERVDQIAIIPKTYFLKDFTFGGIVDIHTKKSDFSAVDILPDMARVLYPLGARPEFEYAAPEYSGDGKQSRTPDLRYLICWKPDILIHENGEATVEFFTSDVEGDYVVQIVGISNEGEILQSENEFSVKAKYKND